ncbi:hypothetical protein [Photobacterium sanguinicancri]|uniref:Fibronectin type-III domain-containing protein n=1 Tax=Photobacterium sanguinicancri TaxID=875932 RepID=A0AAW7Y1H7_9GAMM|nr:hypothetical protein [Photobacterium sanguinicancri]MDO6541920.1 hypothetical protein [Photobacterium sanguinicancri]
MPSLSIMRRALILLPLPLLLVSYLALGAKEEVCAEVSIEIVQKLTIERQGFEATLEIENVLQDKALNDISVDVLFHDDKGNAIKASSNPNSVDAKFFIRILRQEGVNLSHAGSTIEAGKKAKITWLIVPAPGAANNSETGYLYWVSADFNYVLDGVKSSIPVIPDSVFVKTMPNLNLDYFLPKHVYADNPFTPKVEAKEPFPLCVLIRNNGKGVAKNVKIESAQPEIVDNKQGLLIQFEIIGAFLGSEAIQPSLLVNFGDINPNSAKTACWMMQTTLSGRFKNFTASFTHSSELGGQLTSLIEDVNTHTLLHRVLVQLPGHDVVSDLLSDDAGIIRVYDTEGSINDVSLIQTVASPLNENTFTIPVMSRNGLKLIQLPSPNDKTEVPVVIRNDGKRIAPENVWLSKVQQGNEQVFNYTLNIFDNDPKGQFYINYNSQPQENRPPRLSTIPLTIGFTHETSSLSIVASDADNDPLSFKWKGLPSGMVVTQVTANTLKLVWQPGANQQGNHRITVSANDGTEQVSQPLFFTIRSNTDRDGDGLPDDWELEHFNNLNQTGSGDFDGDGISNLDEYLSDRDPSVPDGPAPPIIIAPSQGYVTSLKPELIINNAVYNGRHEIIYEFEVFEGTESTNPLHAYYAVPQGASGVTRWPVPSELKENQDYTWRVRANNGFVKSLWAYGQFTVNSINQAPTKPVLLLPTDSSILDQTNQYFQVLPVKDPDGDSLAYQFNIYSDSELSTRVATSGWLPQDAASLEPIPWYSDAYFNAGMTYYWQVKATDPIGLISTSDIWSFTPSDDLVTVLAPKIVSPKSGERTHSASPFLVFAPTISTNIQRTHYIIDVDSEPDFSSDKLTTYRVDGTAEQYQIQLAGLQENTDYYWRIKAVDTSGLMSEWIIADFFVNVENTAPNTPISKNPGQNSWVASLQPQLATHTVIDVDRDKVYYEFKVYAENAPTDVFWRKQSDTPDRVISQPLSNNQWYLWQARAIDENKVSSDWTAKQRFFTDKNGKDDAPTLTWLNTPDAIIMNYPHDITLHWEDEDPDSNALISLYYIRDGGHEKKLISRDIQEDKDGAFDQQVWKTHDLEKGIYRVYAQISDKATTVEYEAPFILVLSDQYIQPGKVKFTRKTYVTLMENGPVYSSNIQLTKKPYTDVTVHIENKSKGVRLSNSTLTFTPENWFTPQSISYQVVDNCSYLWYQPVKLVPIITEYRDPVYPPMKHNALLGHVINDEPDTSFSPFADICSFKLMQVDRDDSGYIQHYEVTLKSKHGSNLADLSLSLSSRNSSRNKVLTSSVTIPLLAAKETLQLKTMIRIRTNSIQTIPASNFNWMLKKHGEHSQW